MNTDQIAAEAADQFATWTDANLNVEDRLHLTSIIQSAIEKAISYQPKSSEVPQSDDTKRRPRLFS